MAFSGFGLNAAVQAFPAMYEFGRSLFGQDNASKAQAFKEKQAEIELALKQREMDDNAAYRQGVLRGQDFSNETSRMGVENAYNLGRGELDNRIFDSNTRAALGWGALDNEGKRIGISQQVADNTRDYQQGNLKVAQGQLGVTQQQANDIRDYRNAVTGLERDRYNLAREQWSVEKGIQDLRGKSLQQDIRTKENQNNFDSQLQREMVAEQTLEDRFDQNPMSLSPSELAKLNMRYNPYAKEAAQAFDEAADAYVRTQDPKVFTPEVIAAVGRGIQPMLNLNSKYGDGALQLEGFEPANENGMGGVRVRLRKTIKGEDGQMRTTSTYLTEGRGDLADGAKPRIFTGQELHQMLSSLRSIGELQDRHAEQASDRQLRLQAYKLSGGTYQGYEKARYDLEQRRLAANASAEEKAQKEAEHIASMRGANVKDFMSALDNTHPIRSLEPQDGTKATPEYQNLMIAHDKLQSTVDKVMQGASRNALRDGNPMGVMNHPEVAKAYEEYKALYNRYQPPATSTDVPSKEDKHPQQGAFYHPGVQSSGGGTSPFSQAAPERGGSPMGLSRYLTPDKDPNYSLAHMRAPFADRLAAMLEDAPKGVNIYSGWRSREHQARLFNASDRTGHKVAHPGHSNHEHGIAADLKFANKAAREWVHRNAPRYGLSFRMAHENWHIEPAGAGPDARNWGV